jgi:hypothetical protein
LSGYLEWKHFTERKLQGGYFLLKTGQNQYHYFPATVVPDPNALTALLTQKIARQVAKTATRTMLYFWLILVGAVLVFLFV